MTDRGTALEIRDVAVEYTRKHQPPVRAVAGVSLSVESGQVVGLVGESGCGKSTLAKVAVGMIAPSEGEILLHGEPVQALRRGSRPTSQRSLQMVFQDPHSSLNGRRSVGSQIRDALTLASSVPKAEQNKRINELLDMVGLPASAAKAYPHQFSGGQRQRICIARALGADPSVLIADEPISALDASAQAQIANLLLDLTRELEIALLFISHDLSIVHEVVDSFAVMYLGKIVETGKPREVWTRPLHPYTEALMNAVPTVDRPVLPQPLEGDVPDPANPPPGCRFHTRCPYVFDRCRVEDPELVEVTANGTAACHLNEPGNPTDLLTGRGGHTNSTEAFDRVDDDGSDGAAGTDEAFGAVPSTAPNGDAQ